MKKTSFKICGFEDSIDSESYLERALFRDLQLSGEWNQTIKVTVEIIDDEDKEENQ